MRIQHNIMAMNAYRNYNNNTSALSKNLEKLSSGYKINRAGDDAAGLAISEKMRAQITGLNAATKNVKDGISLVKTAEGAMQEIHDMLNRMSYLATQSANGTYDNEVDRANLQKEVDSLRNEINRIADSANFNGINLLDGSMTVKTVEDTAAVEAAAPAVDPAAIANKVDGTDPTAATKATATIVLNGATPTTTGLTIEGGVTTYKALGDQIVDGGAKVSDLFTVKVNGTDVDLTDNVTTIAAGATITFEAKTAGEMTAAAMAKFTTTADAASVEFTNGTAEGSPVAATKAEYSLTFSFANIADGQTFQIGDQLFELSTDNAANAAGATTIDISNLDLTSAAGREDAAIAIQAAIDGVFNATFDVDAAPVGDPGASYTIKMVAKTAGDDGNLGNVRISENATGAYNGKAAITSDYKAGKLAEAGNPGTFAQVTYENFDISKLAVGDKLSIGGVNIEVVEDADADPNNGKITLADAQDADQLVAAFERNGLALGKLEIDGAAKTLTITDATDVGRTADELIADTAISFTAANPDMGVARTTKQTGGLTLQIGDTSDVFNQLTVSIGDMHVKAMGTMEKDADGNDVVKAGESIEDINIASQEDAAAAVDVIKNAINYVSSIRGDLGAIQNRLEHTQNNLSVMTENIQDAESTIRDTDVADEMMAYTKNNILIQSAQAMLAQANAVPQGVLQLLQ